MTTAAWAFALVAGAVAAFNPCGFALLPAYLGLLVAEAPGSRRTAVVRAVRFAAGMTLGFVAVFGAAGLVLAPLAVSIERYLPVVTVVMGVALVALGAWLLAGRHLTVRGLAGHGTAPTGGWWSQFGYGVSFALASLSCTIGAFVAATAGPLASGDALGIAAALLAYALGMGIVVLALAVAVAAARTSLVSRMRRVQAVVGRVSGALMVLAGAYVAWYGWYEIRALRGDVTADPVVSAAVSVQAAIARWVAGLGVTGLLAVGVAAALVAAALLGRRVARRRREPVDRAAR
jgi:cytochrome c-type biogenesis protein